MQSVRAVHTFVAENSDELEFQAGELIEVLERDDGFGDGWWRGRNAKGEEGLFPATYISEQEAAVPSPRHSLHDISNTPSPRGGNAQLAPVSLATESESPRGGATPVIEAGSPMPSIPPTNGSMGGTIDTVQRAIDEQVTKPANDDHGLGIGQDARARLAAQAKLANEQREKQRISGGVSGLVYSDESEDEEDDHDEAYTNGNVLIPKPVEPVPVSSFVPPSKKLSPIPQSAPSSSKFHQAPVVPDSIGAMGGAQTSETRALEPALPLPSTPPTGPVLSGSIPSKPPSNWTVDDVVSWANVKGFDESVCSKFIEHEITGDLLLDLDVNLLKELDIPQFGKRLRIAQAIVELRRPSSVVSGTSQAPPLSPGMAPPAGFAGRGLSAPPSAGSQRSSVTPPSSSPIPDADGGYHSAWSHGRKVSGSGVPNAMEPIKEGQTAPPLPPVTTSVPATASAPSTATSNARSSPATPTTPATTISKRESGGSIGHKKNKSSMDSKDRLSFFGRTRKPAPAASPDQRNPSRLSGSNINRMHEVTPASPNRRQSGTSASAAGIAGDGQAMALKQIGKPDYSGILKKKGEHYGTWKARYFVLKGAHLYYMKSETEDRVKGHIDLKGTRVIVDENTNPGSYGFRLLGSDKQHAFSSSEQTVIRGWMKALMKATIARDYSVAVTSSCNIPTISLAEAQALAPRPPSPATRDATQRANRRENTNTLTAHDANILMGFEGPNRISQTANTPSRPSKDMRRPSSGQPPTEAAAQQYNELLAWVNESLPPQYPKASTFPGSFVSGEVIFLLVRGLSGIEPNPPVTPDAFNREADGLPGIAGLFAMMDMMIDAGIDTAGVSLNEVRSGDAPQMAKLVESVRSWAEQR